MRRSSFVTFSRRMSLVDILSLALTGIDCGRKPGGTSTLMKLLLASADIVRIRVKCRYVELSLSTRI